jgi:AMP nucleosidase
VRVRQAPARRTEAARQANRFYEQAISQHLRIGIATVDMLREEGARLHSRKLRAFDEPPFR